MAKLKLYCVLVGEDRVVFEVEIDETASLSALKQAIWNTRRSVIQCDADQLKLFVAKKKDGAWLTNADVEKGVTATDGFSLVGGDVAQATLNLTKLTAEEVQFTVTLEAIKAKTLPVHVLVEQLTEESVTVHEDEFVYREELMYYEEQGQLIQQEFRDYCTEILDKIDAQYAERIYPFPFICVEGSSGMGKSQLAFALGGRRPWFYWPATTIGIESQALYKNFLSISETFNALTLRDKPVQTAEAEILNANSPHYRKSHLWTYGFIRALLKYCSSEKHQHARMIRFEEKTVLHVDKCSRAGVIEVRDEMERKGKVLPFFVLDEMTPNVNIDGGGKNMAAFQRNVFRACYLVVIVMGTDAKITNLVTQSGGSFKEDHKWVTIISRFASYCPIPLKNKSKQRAWDRVKQQYPIVQAIAAGSRGRFARYFVDSVVETALEHASVELCDLLDQACTDVSRRTQVGKRFMGDQNGKDAQLMAISNSNTHMELPTNTENDMSETAMGTSEDVMDTFEPAQKKRKLRNGTHCMNLHFANLVDDQFTVLYLSSGKLKVGDEYWKPKCRFPSINEDLLLYLSVLGGKKYSGYYDFPNKEANSTKQIFKAYLGGKGFSTELNTNAVKNDFMVFENMVAHMIFCASRRNGVQGIPFVDFFAGLLGEFQDEYKEMKLKTIAIIDEQEERVDADVSKLFAGYASLTPLLATKVPFLAPPNAEWPKCLLETRRHGCNFGHLVRAPDKERCDVYVRTADDNSGGAPLFLCECKYWSKNLDMGTMKRIVGGLESVWKDKWTIVLVFCVKLAKFRSDWKQKVSEKIGCVKIDCQSCHADWVCQAAEGHRNKLVVVMETGAL